MYKFIKIISDTFTKYSQKDAKLLTSFVIMILIVTLHVYFLIYAHKEKNFSYLEQILITDYVALLALLGIEAFNGKNSNNNTPDRSDHPGDIQPEGEERDREPRD